MDLLIELKISAKLYILSKITPFYKQKFKIFFKYRHLAIKSVRNTDLYFFYHIIIYTSLNIIYTSLKS